MSDLIIKEVNHIYQTKNSTKEQIKKYKRYRKEFRTYLTGIYIHEKLALSIIMDYTTPAATEFTTELGINQYDLIMTKNNQCCQK